MRARPHPKAILGSIGHAICDFAAKGKLGTPDDNWDARFASAWERKADTALGDNPDLGEAASWPGYNLQRALWKRMAFKLSALWWEIEQDPDRELESEVELTGFDARIGGSADLVIRHGSEVEIRDLKSGRVLAAEGEVSPAYRRQLQLYGVLYEETFGVWPARLLIDPLIRDPIEVSADRLQARRLADATLRALENLNTATAEGRLRRLASPKPEICRFCSHPIRCEPFWRKVTPDWSERPRALSGKIASIRPGSLVILVDRGSIPPGEVTIGGVPIIGEADTGDRISVVGYERRPHNRIVVGDNTEISLDG